MQYCEVINLFKTILNVRIINVQAVHSMTNAEISKKSKRKIW